MSGAKGYEEAALRVLQKSGFEQVLSRVLTVGGVVAEAGFASKGTFSASTTKRDLVDHLANRTIGDEAQRIAGVVACALLAMAEAIEDPDTPVDLHDAVADLARTSFDAQLENLVDHRLLLLAAAASADDDTRERLAGFYERFLGEYVPAYERFFEVWGREVRDGYTAKDIAIVLAALNDGFLLQATFGEPSRQLYGDAVICLVLALTRRVGSGMAEYAGDPTPDAHLAHPAPAAPDAGDRSLAWRIERAAQRLYRDGGWAALTMTNVAAEAGLPRVTPRAVMDAVGHRGNLAALAVGPAITADVEAVVTGSPDPAVRVMALIDLARRFAVANKAEAVALLAALTTTSMHPGLELEVDAAVPLRPVLEAAIAAWAAAGGLDAQYAHPPHCADLADVLVITALHRAVSKGASQSELAPTVALILKGAGAA